MAARNQYTDLMDEEGDEVVRHGGPRSGGSGSATVDQPGGSRQPRSRVRRAPEDDVPLPPPPADDALIARINMIITEPGRKMPRLDPDLPDKDSFWFGVQPIVGRTITETIKKHFHFGWYNWRDATTQEVRDQWFELWTKQYWSWDPALTYRVRREFEKKGCKRLCDAVSRWKVDWEARGNDAKPYAMADSAWKGLVDYWLSKKGQDHAASASKSRNTPVAPGDLSSRHRLGQTPMAGLRWKMAKESESGELPPVIEVYERAYRKPDGSYVTKKAEQLCLDYERAVNDEIMTRDSQGDSSATPMTTQDFDNIFRKVAPKKKGRIHGMGSMDEVPACSSSSRHQAASRQAAIDAELAEHRRFREEAIARETAFREETFARETAFMNVLQVMAGDNPVYLEAIRSNLFPRGPPVQPPTEAQVSQQEANLRTAAGLPPLDLNRNSL